MEKKGWMPTNCLLTDRGGGGGGGGLVGRVGGEGGGGFSTDGKEGLDAY